MRPQPHQVPVQGQVRERCSVRRRARSAALEVSFMTTVNGPVVGYATVGTAQRWRSPASAPATARTCWTCCTTAGCPTGRFNSPQSFIKAAELTPQTFNSFYVDDKHVAEYTTGLLPLRAQGHRSEPADRRQPASGSGGATCSTSRPSPGHRPTAHPDHGHDDQLEQRLRAWLRRRRRRVGRQWLVGARVAAQLRPGRARRSTASGRWRRSPPR